VQQVLTENRKVVGGDGRQLIYVPMPGATQESSAPNVLPADIAAPTVNATTEPRPDRTTRPAGREEPSR